jgi:Tfp pilus assembly protein FimT
MKYFRRIQRGFTLPELLLAVWAIVVICVITAVLVVAGHFIAKHW